MASITGSSLSGAISTAAHWLEQHSYLAMLLLVVLPAAVGYWYYVLRSCRAAAASRAEPERIVTPLMLGPLALDAASPRGRRLLAPPGPAPFGQWLLIHLARQGITPAQLARRLGRPKEAIQAVMYGVPVGRHLPSLALVDAICDALQLDREAGRAAFFSSLSESDTPHPIP